MSSEYQTIPSRAKGIRSSSATASGCGRYHPSAVDANVQRVLDDSEGDSPRGLEEHGDVELVSVGAGAGHGEDVSRGKTSVAIRVAEREGAVREGPENPAREGDVRQHRDSVLPERRTHGPVQGELGTPERKVRGRMPRVRSLGGEAERRNPPDRLAVADDPEDVSNARIALGQTQGHRGPVR